MSTRPASFARALLVRAAASGAAVVLVLTASAGCDPVAPSLLGGGAAATPPHAVLEPEASPDAAPRVVRIRIVPEPGAITDVSRLLFVIGHVGPAHVRQLENDDVSNALAERVVPALAWLEPDGSAVIAPTVVLDPGQTYGALSGDPPLGLEMHVDPADPIPVLGRTWPPADRGEAGGFAILCGELDLAAAPAEVEISPYGLAASLMGGAAGGIAPRCLRLDVAPDGLETIAKGGDFIEGGIPASSDETPRGLPPALITLADGSQVRLDPAPIALAPPAAAVDLPALDCDEGQLPFGPGCARVTDDRVFVASPDAPLLWALSSAAIGGDAIHLTEASEPWVLLGLTPAAPAAMTLVTVDLAGRARACALELHTEAPMAHVVISEVMANPLGAEPDQEWVEITNDGLVAADLTGYGLADIGGDTLLPAAVLAPGAFALIVNESFIEDDELDPKPAAGTLLLRVAKLGKDGLKNDGEPLKLHDAAGLVLSRFPAAPKPKAGMSLARLSASAADGDPASFAIQWPTPGAVNEVYP